MKDNEELTKLELIEELKRLEIENRNLDWKNYEQFIEIKHLTKLVATYEKIAFLSFVVMFVSILAINYFARLGI